MSSGDEEASSGVEAPSAGVEAPSSGDEGTSSGDGQASSRASGDGEASSRASGDDEAFSGDDEASSGDGEASSGDDEASSGDNEASSGDDEASSGDDEASSGDDEASSGDDEASSGDDEASSGDDEASSGDDDSSDTEDGPDPLHNAGATAAKAWKRISKDVARSIPRVKWTVKRPTRVVFVDLSRRGKLSKHIARKNGDKRSAVPVEDAIEHMCTPVEGMAEFKDVELKQDYKDRGIVLRRRMRVTGGHSRYLQPLAAGPMHDFVVTPQYLLFIKDKDRAPTHLAVCSFGFNTYTQLSEYASKDFVAKLVVKFINESYVKEIVEKSVSNQVTRSARRFKHATQLTPAKAWNTDVSKVVAPALGSRAARATDSPSKWRKKLLEIFDVDDKRNDGAKRVRGLTISAASAFQFTSAHPVDTAVQLVDLLYAAGASNLSAQQKLLKGMMHPLKEASTNATRCMLKDVHTFLTGEDVATLVVVAEPVQDEDSRMDFDAWVAGDWKFMLKGGRELDPPVDFHVGMLKVDLLAALKKVWDQFWAASRRTRITPAVQKKYAKQLCIQRWEAHDNGETSPADEKPVLVSDWLQWVRSGERTVLQMEEGEVKQLSAGHVAMTRLRVKTWQASAKLPERVSKLLQLWHLCQARKLHREDTFNFSHWNKTNWVVGDCSTSKSSGVELYDLMYMDEVNKRAYLFHVKQGFGAGPLREVTQQLLISARLIDSVRNHDMATAAKQQFFRDHYKEIERTYASKNKSADCKAKPGKVKVPRDKFVKFMCDKRTQFTFVMALAVGKSVKANKVTLKMDNQPRATFNSPWLVAEMMQKFAELSTSTFSLKWCRVRVGPRK